MSAFGPKRISLVALHMSACGCKADTIIAPEIAPMLKQIACLHCRRACSQVSMRQIIAA
jgi:hypothetical protein